jgi:hypothetical protein
MLSERERVPGEEIRSVVEQLGNSKDLEVRKEAMGVALL